MSNASQRSRPQARRAKTSPNLASKFTAHNSETEREHALIAAEIAYERVYGRGMRKRDVTNTENGQGPKASSNAGDGPQLVRRQSIRFAGPNAEPKRTRSITRREAPEYRSSQEIRRHSLLSESKHGSIPYPAHDDSSLTALPTEFGENDVASAPSSYRRLRKAKSMFSPGKVPSAVFPHGIPKAGRHFQRHSQLSSDGTSEPVHAPDPRLRRSLSFLRGVTDRINTTSNRQYLPQDETIQLARDTYLQQLEQQRLKQQPSFLNLSKHRTKAFRRSVRSSSTNSYGTAVGSSASFDGSISVKGIGAKARSLSQNLKTRIRTAFQRSKNEQSTIPVQQVNASHAHYGNTKSTSITQNEQHFSPFHEPNAELLHRVGSRGSLEQFIPYLGDRIPGAKSIRSVQGSDDDESNERSRVSSWTNSTVNNTLVVPQKMERKRLSIIKEDGGPHQPSSSARFYGNQHDGYATFRLPVSQTDLERVETERVFSALQREIEDNRRRAALGHVNSGTEIKGGPDQQRPQNSLPTPRRSSSLRRCPDPPPKNATGDAVIKTSKSWDAGEMLHQMVDGSNHREYLQYYGEQRDGLTPQEIAQMAEPKIQLVKRPLREVKSAFFPPSMRIERKNTSPFRRSMQASSEDENGFQVKINNTDRIKVPEYFNSTGVQVSNGSVARSESVYSRSPGGYIAGAIESDISLAPSSSSDGVGTAIIIAKEPAKYDGQKQSSANSSGTRNKFMASQISFLERHQPSQDDTFNAYPVKKSGHKRESAQINEDDVNIGGVQAPTSNFSQPLGDILGKGNAQLSLHRHGSHSAPFRPSSSWDTNVQNENTPLSHSYPYPYKSLNGSNENHSPSTIRSQPGDMLETIPQDSSGPPKPQKWLSISPSKRNSPERIERLRRLKNNSTPSLRKPMSPNENQVNRKIDSTNHRPGPHDPDVLDMSPTNARSRIVSDKQVENSFLKDRRSYLSVNGGSEKDSAFI